MASPAESYGKAKVAATKALEIDDKLGDAHATLALILTWNEWNWPAGEAEFKRAWSSARILRQLIRDMVEPHNGLEDSMKPSQSNETSPRP